MAHVAHTGVDAVRAHPGLAGTGDAVDHHGGGHDRARQSLQRLAAHSVADRRHLILLHVGRQELQLTEADGLEHGCPTVGVVVQRVEHHRVDHHPAKHSASMVRGRDDAGPSPHPGVSPGFPRGDRSTSSSASRVRRGDTSPASTRTTGAVGPALSLTHRETARVLAAAFLAGEWQEEAMAEQSAARAGQAGAGSGASPPKSSPRTTGRRVTGHASSPRSSPRGWTACAGRRGCCASRSSTPRWPRPAGRCRGSTPSATWRSGWSSTPGSSRGSPTSRGSSAGPPGSCATTPTCTCRAGTVRRACWSARSCG